MSNFFLDSSALVKRYLTEIGSNWVRRLTDPTTANSITVVEITQVEVAAALAARHRAPARTTIHSPTNFRPSPNTKRRN